MGANKLVVGGVTKFDWTGLTADKNKVLRGYTAGGKDGEVMTGECDFDADTSDGTITADELPTGEIGYARGNRIVGTMPIRGGVTLTIVDADTPVSIPAGSHDGSGRAVIDADELAKLVPENIRENVSILGRVGTMTGDEEVSAQTKSVTPTMSAQVVLPDTAQGYTHLSQVNVAAIPYTETPNAAGGYTITIG